MVNLIIGIVVSAASFLIGARLIKGIEIEGFQNALWLALLVALLNGTLGRVLTTATLGLLGLGLFQFILNAIIILVANMIMKQFKVESFWSALLLAIVVFFSNQIMFWALNMVGV